MAEQLNLKDLKAIVERQAVKINWMAEVLAAQGIEGPWLTPPQAAPILQVGVDRIKREIARAESQRKRGIKSDLAYGKHYWNKQDPEKGGRAALDVSLFREVLKIPPENRNLG